MTTNRPQTEARLAGAVAGLAPAAALAILLVAAGAETNRDTVRWLAVASLVAVAAGSLIGPRVCGSLPADLWAAVGFALIGAAAYVVIGTAMSIVTGPPIDGDLIAGLAWRVSGQLLYGLLYLPLAVAVLTPFGLVWVGAASLLWRRVGLRRPRPVDSWVANKADRPGHGGSSGRLALYGAAITAGYGVFVALLPLGLYHEPQPAWSLYRPVALFVLFGLPAGIAVIGATRNRPSLIVVAGVICLAQSNVSFSLVTVGFLVPAILFLTQATAAKRAGAAGESPTMLAASGLVFALVLAAWVAALGMTEEVCWTSTSNPDGSSTFERVPTTEVMTIHVGQSGGCDGGTLTLEGMGVGAVLAIGAVAIAAASTWSRRAIIVAG